MDIEKGIDELRLQADVSNGREKKELQGKIKKAEDSVKAMKIARKSLRKFIGSFESFNRLCKNYKNNGGSTIKFYS